MRLKGFGMQNLSHVFSSQYALGFTLQPQIPTPLLIAMSKIPFAMLLYGPFGPSGVTATSLPSFKALTACIKAFVPPLCVPVLPRIDSNPNCSKYCSTIAPSLCAAVIKHIFGISLAFA